MRRPDPHRPPLGPAVQVAALDHTPTGWHAGRGRRIAMSDKTSKAAVEAFNRDNMIGTFVRYWTGVRQGVGKVSTTRTAAELLSGHTPVVWVAAEASCIALTHVEPVPHQPDGIDEYNHFTLPDVQQAAERVLAYITEFGDGLYDVQGRAPLYGRDLEVLARHAMNAAEAGTR
jgi:hypothetical protein